MGDLLVTWRHAAPHAGHAAADPVQVLQEQGSHCWRVFPSFSGLLGCSQVMIRPLHASRLVSPTERMQPLGPQAAEADGCTGDPETKRPEYGKLS